MVKPVPVGLPGEVHGMAASSPSYDEALALFQRQIACVVDLAMTPGRGFP